MKLGHKYPTMTHYCRDHNGADLPKGGGTTPLWKFWTTITSILIRNSKFFSRTIKGLVDVYIVSQNRINSINIEGGVAIWNFRDSGGNNSNRTIFAFRLVSLFVADRSQFQTDLHKTSPHGRVCHKEEAYCFWGQKVKRSTKVNKSVNFLNSSIFIGLTWNLKRIYISDDSLQPPNCFRGQHRPKVNN